MECIENSHFLQAVGITTAIYITYKVLNFVLTYFTPSFLDLKAFGKWALVTGSTDGIGKAIARKFAKLGINIVLVSRNPEKLERVAKEIEEDFHVEVKYVTFDFTQADEVIDEISSVYDIIREEVDKIEIGILVNNVGMLPKKELFLNLSDSANVKTALSRVIRNVINCNVMSMVKMTQLILPQMVKRRKGLVLNLTSLTTFVPFATFGLYSSTKKFNDTYSQALTDEYLKDGIIVQSIMPGPVITTPTIPVTGDKPTFLVAALDTYIKHLWWTIGKGKLSFGYWHHELVHHFLPFEKRFVETLLKDLQKEKNARKEISGVVN